MEGPSPTITKKRGGKSQKGAKRHAEKNASNERVPETLPDALEIEISPVSIKGKPTEAADLTTFSSTMVGRGARRKLDLSSIDISSIAPANLRADSIGDLTRLAFSSLRGKDSGRCEVALHVSVIRVPRAWEKFKFFLLADHTGVVSLGAGVDKFEILKPYLDDKNFPPLYVNGFVYFKWSSKNKGEIYMTIRDNDSQCESEGVLANPASFCAFHTIRNIIASPYYASVQFNRLIGDCLLVQRNGSKMSIMLQDSNGLALLHILNWENNTGYANDKSKPELRGATLIEGSVKFQTAEIDGVEAIAATVEYKDVSVKKIRETILTKHISLIKNTPKHDYQFSFDDCVYAIRSSL